MTGAEKEKNSSFEKKKKDSNFPTTFFNQPWMATNISVPVVSNSARGAHLLAGKTW